MLAVRPLMRECWLILSQSKTAASELHSTLTALRDRNASRSLLSQRLAAEIMSLTDTDQRPSPHTVSEFADEFVGALIGKDLTQAQVTNLQRSITEMLDASTKRNYVPASRLREAVTALRVDPREKQAITRSFIAIGEEIRGPDDTPVR